jgi:DNA-binding PucR family transcriptional regulator
VGAKELHMHRNTFMNKIERFNQGMGLNIKDFNHAVLAYLLIFDLENESKM